MPPEPSIPSHTVRVIVVRAWREESGAFRARVTIVPDLGAPEEHAQVAGSPEEAVELVRSWLAEI